MENQIFNTDFCLQIAQQIALEKANEGANFVFSPVSIHASLSLTAAGSTGKTLEQLLFVLKSSSIHDLNQSSLRLVKLLSPQSNGGPVLSFANSVWVDKCFPMKPLFIKNACGTHGTQAKDVDFITKAEQVTQEINVWVENATNGLIRDALPPGSVTNTTVAMIVNALYFKGVWKRTFSHYNTRERAFHLLNGETIQVPFVTKEEERHFFRAFDDYKVLKLPYENGQDKRQFSMYFLLPDAEDGLNNLIQKLNSKVGFFNQDFQLRSVELKDFAIPKFKIAFRFEAKDTIKKLGLVLPFMDVGELSEMVDCDQGIFVSSISHSACVEVNEQGTEAAASTSTGFRRLCAVLSPPSFVANHPFLFMIREETSRMVLFIGAMLNPSSVS